MDLATASMEYRQGYDTALFGLGWNWNPYPPGSPKFHAFMEGHGDGMKARAMYVTGTA